VEVIGGRSAVLLTKALTLPASRAPSTKPAARRRVSQMPTPGPVEPAALRGYSSVQPIMGHLLRFKTS
jgi:hypothetical protein